MRPTTRKWILLLGGLLIWAAHFFLLYAFASIFPGSDTARWLTVAATVLGLGANGVIVRAAVSRHDEHSSDDLEHWARQVAIPECVLSIAAVLWQGLTVLF